MKAGARRFRDGCLAPVMLFLLCGTGSAVFGEARAPKAAQQAPLAVEYERKIELFNKVYDILFPRYSTGEYYFALRYIPAFEPESQILISHTDDGTYDFEYYFLPKGSKSVGEQILKLRAELHTDTPEELARHIRVEHSRICLPTRVVSRLMDSYSAIRLPAQLDPRLIMDATRYEFWFVTLSARHELHVAVTDSDYGQRAVHPLVRWMNHVRHVVEKTAVSRK